MVLSRKAVEEFLERPLRDSSTTKSLSDAELDERLERAGFDSRKPRRAQKISLLLGWKYPSYLFLLDVGGGKTYLSLTLFQRRVREGSVKRLLVAVPNIVNLSEWESQVKTHVPEFCVKYVDAEGVEARRDQLLDESIDIVVMTYQGLAQLCSKTAVVLKDGKKTDKNRWVLDDEATDKIASSFGMLVLDECTAIRSKDSIYFRIVRRLRKTIDFCYGLTGTPFDKNPEDLWSQFFLIDQGYTLGETLGLYREAFFTKVARYWGGFDYRFQKKLLPELQRRLAHRSVRFSKEECQDLPPAVGGLAGDDPMFLQAVLSRSARGYYDALHKKLIDARGSFALTKNAYTRMRMVSSGWIGAIAEDGSGERLELEFEENPKLDVTIDKLLEILESESEKVLLIHWFQTSGRLLTDRLKKEGIEHVWIYGETSPSKKIDALARFKDPKGPRVLVGSTAISKGVNLQDVARYTIFFESPDNAIERAQLEGRTHREGRFHTTRYFYDAVCKGTIDVRIFELVKAGRTLLDELLDREVE